MAAMKFSLANPATTGFSDGSRYDKYRPSYSSEAVSKLLTHLNIASVARAKVVDLACGTGKFTECLAVRPEEFEIVGVEPHDGMREVLQAKQLGSHVKVLNGDAAHMPIENDWADVVIAAQAFHWFATEESLKEIHRVLVPGGAFGMIWNIEDYNAPKEWEATSKWEQKLKDIVNEHEDGHTRFRHLAWKQIFEQQLDTTPWQTLKDTFAHNMPNFSLPLGEETLKWTIWLTDEAVWDRYTTLSMIANTEGAERERIKKEVIEALKGADVERNAKGEVAVHGATYMAWTSRI
ncbi:hypothetical protein BP5796_10446 [Coleophoma crateriformis]|uniref:Methyltransferase type 11 domain-containing protein n=1 Tax=Coleophoma crateriformis TaxID=565419 RepID=A0A3D8QR23_9HELO|nr:hypothetical protein BP5796_10446 [Coleophoma crateriformis]